MVTCAQFELANTVMLYILIWLSIRKAFDWQYGNKIREDIPNYAEIVHMATMDMKGDQVYYSVKFLERAHANHGYEGRPGILFCKVSRTCTWQPWI
jgi:hypothetical protein